MYFLKGFLKAEAYLNIVADLMNLLVAEEVFICLYQLSIIISKPSKVVINLFQGVFLVKRSTKI